MEEKIKTNSDNTPEVSKIRLQNGQTFNLKDAELRKQIKEFLGDLIGDYEDEQ